ncbi:MAG TPA: integrase [Clostridiaceae bacterium]|nr:integrase [Clostridiaceae bacterium]
MKKIKMKQEVKNKNPNEAFTEFKKHCTIKNLSEKTIKYYDECFLSFLKFYGETNPLADISKDTIDDYIIYLRTNTGFNDVSINTRLRGIRTILKHFMELGYIEDFKISLIEAEKPLKETYTDEELELLLKKPNIKTCSFPEYRTWVIVNYLLSTANRLSTITNIKIEDLNFDDELLQLKKVKNKKQYIIPMSTSLAKILQEYLMYRKGKSEDYLFCTVEGEKLSTNTLESNIRRYNLKRGVSKTSIHLFRHTFAKKWILAGGDIFRLQKILGHSSLDVVREYLNMFSDDLKISFNKFNPLEQFKTNKNYIKMRK